MRGGILIPAPGLLLLPCFWGRIKSLVTARSLVAWLAVEEVGHPSAEVARHLGISRVGVLFALERAKDICQRNQFELTSTTPDDARC